MRHLFWTPVLALFAIAAACEDSGTVVRLDAPGGGAPEGFVTPGPVQTGWILGRDGRPMEVTYEVQYGHAIWEGDIDLGLVEDVSATAEEAARRAREGGARLGVAIDGTSYRWRNGVVPYEIPSGFPDASRITSAMAHIEANNQGVDFVPRNGESDYITFVTSTGCSSKAGRRGGAQRVRLGDGCSTGNTIHELLHALGMFHEQTRCDRDSYVTIQTANIIPERRYNFDKHCDDGTDYVSYAEGSIMHYSAYAFSSNGEPTIVSKRGLSSMMGQRDGMNSTDIATVDTLYPPPSHDQGGGADRRPN